MPFKKGQSGNPGGRPSNPFAKLIRESTKDGKEIITRVLKLFRTTKNEKIIIQGAEFLRDTGWGKPVQPLEHGGNESRILVVTSRSKEGKENG